MSVTIINDALELLQSNTPKVSDLAARIEELNLCAFDVGYYASQLTDQASAHEEEATADASSESNADKRKTKRCELLRDNSEYQALKLDIHEAERMKLMLSERAHRYARELRLSIATQTATVF